MYTIVETAKANKVNVYLYLKYLLERIPEHLDANGAIKDRDFLPDMMPWSDAYKTYEKQCIDNRYVQYQDMFPAPEIPKTPRKKASSPPKDTGQSTA